MQQNEKRAVQQELIIELVQRIRASNKKMGVKKLYKLLELDLHSIDSSMGRDKFFDLLRDHGLLVKRNRKYAVTTRSSHRFRVYENKLKDFTASAPHQAWVCDITYVRVKKGFVYLFLLTDVYSRKIVGWDVNESLGLEGALQSLAMAIKQCPRTKNLIHHSDRGFQYCSHEYVDRLKTKGIEVSMAEAGNCYENAMAERINGILKTEYGLDETFDNKEEVTKVVKESIQAYNEQRPHWSLDLQIPSQVHEAA